MKNPLKEDIKITRIASLNHYVDIKRNLRDKEVVGIMFIGAVSLSLSLDLSITGLLWIL